MKPILGVLKPYRAGIVLTLILVLAQTLAELGLPTLMAGLIDKGVLGHDASVLVTSGLGMVGLALAGSAASVAAAWVSSRVAAGYGRDLRSIVFRKTTGLTVTEFGRFGAATLITRTTNDVTQVVTFVILTLRMLASAPLMAVGGLVLATAQNPQLSLVLWVAVVILAVAMTLLAQKAVGLFQKLQQKLDRLNLVLRESLTGVRVLRAFDRQEFDSQRFQTANLDLTGVALKTQKLMAFVMPGMMLAMSLTSVALVWFGALRVEAGTLQVGGLMAFLQYAVQILFSLMMLSMLFVFLPRAAVSARRIDEVLGLPDHQAEPSESPPPEKPGAAVEFRHVTFRYPGAEQAALDDVSFSVPAGSTLALIGGTGSGKSTVVGLISRFHDATEGQVLVDDLDVRRWPLEALRRRLGLSAQKARLFTGTVASNLRWGDPEATDPALRSSLDAAQASDFVEALGGLEGQVSQGGSNLSGGQKQRMSIARGLVRGPAVLLLDDSFSALDALTDARLREALRSRAQGTTVILVAQRVSTVRGADRIVVLDNGRMVGQGTHQELLATCPIYQEIATSQESEDPS